MKHLIIVFLIITATVSSAHSEISKKSQACLDIEATARMVASYYNSESTIGEAFVLCKGQELCEDMVLDIYTLEDKIKANSGVSFKEFPNRDYHQLIRFTAKHFKKCMSLETIPETSGIKTLR